MSSGYRNDKLETLSHEKEAQIWNFVKAQIAKWPLPSPSDPQATTPAAQNPADKLGVDVTMPETTAKKVIDMYGASQCKPRTDGDVEMEKGKSKSDGPVDNPSAATTNPSLGPFAISSSMLTGTRTDRVPLPSNIAPNESMLISPDSSSLAMGGRSSDPRRRRLGQPGSNSAVPPANVENKSKEVIVNSTSDPGRPTVRNVSTIPNVYPSPPSPRSRNDGSPEEVTDNSVDEGDAEQLEHQEDLHKQDEKLNPGTAFQPPESTPTTQSATQNGMHLPPFKLRAELKGIEPLSTTWLKLGKLPDPVDIAPTRRRTGSKKIAKDVHSDSDSELELDDDCGQPSESESGSSQSESDDELETEIVPLITTHRPNSSRKV